MEWDRHKAISPDGKAVLEVSYYENWAWHVDYEGDDGEWERMAEGEADTEAQAKADCVEAWETTCA